MKEEPGGSHAGHMKDEQECWGNSQTWLKFQVFDKNLTHMKKIHNKSEQTPRVQLNVDLYLFSFGNCILYR
uniref:Uncharacterized protein n=1 Tax=Ciona intestinalis TaxID=7719 RepID=H2XUE0_CIOIN